MSIELNKASKEYLNSLKIMPITKWVQVNAINYMKNFFSCKHVTVDSFTKPSFVNDGFDRFLPIAQIYCYDAIPVKTAEFVRMILRGGKYADRVTKSYRMAEKFFDQTKDKPIDPGKQNSQTLNQYLNNSEFYVNGGSDNNNDCLLDIVLHWEDKFPEMKRRLVAACDYILTHCVNEQMVSADLALKKFPQVVDFFSLEGASLELAKFCYTFRATGLKLPRDVQSFEDRMRQLGELINIDGKDIEEFAEINKKRKQFYPFIVETVALQDNVWSFMANERADSLEDCFYKVLKTDDALPRNFFDKIDEENSDVIIKLINGDAHRDRPRHILLYGKPGTGKTSYMKLISKLSGRKAFVITQAAPTDNRNNREYDTEVESRFMSITICDERVNSKKSIIIVDEADEMINCSQNMFPGWGFSNGQTYDTHIKSLLNQVMDSVETPIIWITNNNPYAIDPSCRRRFDYSIFFDDFNEAQRKLIWQNNVKRFNLKNVTPAMIDDLAAEYAVTPGGIATACQDLLDINPAKEDVYKTLSKVLDRHCELLCIPSQKKMNEKFKPVKNYSLEGLNIESMIQLKEVQEICANYLEKKANKQVERGLCILLSGPSGTGKTEFCKYLGSVLKKNVRVVRGSTVLDKYVGETEKRIASEFHNAEDSDTILFMDEIDGLLGGRERTMHSWEVSQVNEILQQMEQFRGIFIAATNFSENLDNASTRRFAFKFKFDYLNEDGIIEFYKRYFGRIDSKNKFYEKLKNLHMVAPGDFAVVKMLSEYSKDKINAEWVYNSLKREIDAKKGNSGFKMTKPKNIGY